MVLSLGQIVLKNELGEIWKACRSCLIRFHKVFKSKNSEKHYLRLLQLYMPCINKNELKQDNQSYEDRCEGFEGDILCNIKKHEPYLVKHEELQNFSFVQPDEEGEI